MPPSLLPDSCASCALLLDPSTLLWPLPSAQRPLSLLPAVGCAAAAAFHFHVADVLTASPALALRNAPFSLSLVPCCTPAGALLPFGRSPPLLATNPAARLISLTAGLCSSCFGARTPPCALASSYPTHLLLRLFALRPCRGHPAPEREGGEEPAHGACPRACAAVALSAPRRAHTATMPRQRSTLARGPTRLPRGRLRRLTPCRKRPHRRLLRPRLQVACLSLLAADGVHPCYTEQTLLCGRP
jgi:hypothetical protein